MFGSNPRGGTAGIGKARIEEAAKRKISSKTCEAAKAAVIMSAILQTNNGPTATIILGQFRKTFNLFASCVYFIEVEKKLKNLFSS